MLTTENIITKSKARLTPIRNLPGSHHNWLFLPGGPGLGSESLKSLTEFLHLPGTMWLVDMPGDGSNQIENDENAFSHWQQALIDATQALDNVVLIAHSTGGMMVLSTPELESIIKGLVLIATAPDASFHQGFAEYVAKNPLPDAEKLQKDYVANPCNETFKKLTMSLAPYVSTKSGCQTLTALMDTLPLSYKPHLWAALKFHQTYKAKWVPQTMPVLIFAGDQDYLTPITLFSNLPDFRRVNISIKTIANASHFPWLENPEQVKKVFEEYSRAF